MRGVWSDERFVWSLLGLRFKTAQSENYDLFKNRYIDTRLKEFDVGAARYVRLPGRRRTDWTLYGARVREK